MRQDIRRGWRTVVYAIVTLVCIAFIGWIIWLGDTLTIRHIAYGLLVIVGTGSFGYIAENVTQRLWFKFGSAEAGIGETGNPVVPAHVEEE